MKKTMMSKRKILVLILSLVLIIIFAVLIFKISSIKIENKEDIKNYIVTKDGLKLNTSKEVATDKMVENILLQKNEIVCENGTSKLTAKVTNDSIARENLRFKVKFIANDGSIIAETVGFIGKIEKNQIKQIVSYITIDVSDSKNITYELIK